jgi:GxxExxY protein
MTHVGRPRTATLLHAEEVFRIQGAIFEVYRSMGPGFLEAVYQECMELEFGARGIPFVSRAPLEVRYNGRALKQRYVADFVCFDKVILELKGVARVAAEHRAQTINYLRATGLGLGLLVNFGASPRVQIERFAL